MSGIHVTLQKQELLKHALLVERVSGKNLSLPALNGVQIVAEKNALILRATNLDLGVEVRVAAKVESTGSLIVPGTLLSQIVGSSFQGDSVELKDTDGVLHIITSDGESEVKTLSDEDFPTLPSIEDKQSVVVEAKKLALGLNSVYYSASTSTIKPELSSVYIYPVAKEVVFVATDSFRLAEKKVSAAVEGEFDYFLVPIRNVPDITRILEYAEGDATVHFNEHQISFQFDSVYITSRLTDGTFPDYKQIIPKEYVSEVTLLKSDFLQACKRTNIFSDRFHQVQFNINPKEKRFTITSKNPEVGESTTSLEGAVEGEALSISFNLKYISDALQSIAVDSITLSFSGAGKPMVINGVGDQSFTYLVMPMNR